MPLCSRCRVFVRRASNFESTTACAQSQSAVVDAVHTQVRRLVIPAWEHCGSILGCKRQSGEFPNFRVY